MSTKFETALKARINESASAKADMTLEEKMDKIVDIFEIYGFEILKDSPSLIVGKLSLGGPSYVRVYYTGNIGFNIVGRIYLDSAIPNAEVTNINVQNTQCPFEDFEEIMTAEVKLIVDSRIGKIEEISKRVVKTGQEDLTTMKEIRSIFKNW